MTAQIAQDIVLDVDAVNQNMSMLVMVKAWNQASQGGFSTPRASDERHHLPRLDDETDIIEHLFLTAVIAERQVPDVKPTRNPFTLYRPVINLRRLVQLRKNTFGTGQPFLNRRADFGKLTNRLGQHPGRRNVGD